jgi:hypothetical protein
MMVVVTSPGEVVDPPREDVGTGLLVEVVSVAGEDDSGVVE